MSTYVYNDRKNPINIDSLPTPGFVKDYLFHLWKLEEKTPKSVMNYYISVQSLLKWLKANQLGIKIEELKDGQVEELEFSDIERLTSEDIKEYLKYCSEVNKNGTSSVACKTSALKSFFSYYTNISPFLTENPMTEVSFPKRKTKLPRALSKENLIKVINAAKYGENPNRNYCIVVMLAFCGLRLSELVNINNDDINGEILTVTGPKQREIVLDALTLSSIDRYVTERTNYYCVDKKAFFISDRKGKRMTARGMQEVLVKIFARAGLKDFKYSAHDLRHTAAVMMLENETRDISELSRFLGNISEQITGNYAEIAFNEKS